MKTNCKHHQFISPKIARAVSTLHTNLVCHNIYNMEYMKSEDLSTSIGKILCCDCGTPIDPNPSNMCVACIRTRVDITECIPKQVILYFCKDCERYLEPPNTWVACALESKELLAFCLKKLRTLNQLHLVNANFIWTEPHSKRINLQLTVQKEVLGGAIMQQVFVVQYVVNTQMCSDCRRQDTKNFWKAVVQVRQRVKHKKTFFYLEQTILKHKAHTNCINIRVSNDGVDFYFAKKDDARKMIDFFTAIVPCKYITSQQLVSHDTHNNTYNYKYTFSVEIVPVCKHDVVCLPLSLARSLGNIGQICIVNRVTNSIYLIDPFTLQTASISSQQYWRNPFSSIASVKQLTEYTVINIEYLMDNECKVFSGQGPISQKHVLADAYVVRSSELGVTDSEIHTRTHIGHLLRPGDLALGLDLASINVNNKEFNKMDREKLPDAILISKVYADRATRHRNRKWKLKHLNNDFVGDTSSDEREYVEFLEDLEEDPVIRQNVNIYKDYEKLAVDADDADDDFPKVTLQELLDDLTLEDPTGEEGGSMIE